MKFFIPTMLVWFYVKNVLTLECYWNNGCNYKYFGSKTSYEIIRGDIRDSVVRTKGCEVVSIWSIMRHGKRNPSDIFANPIKEILKYKDFIVSSYENGNSSLCAQDIENIKKWDGYVAMLSKPNEITEEGYQELLRIGNRMKEAFPELLERLQEQDYLFLSLFGHRFQESARAYVKALDHNLTIETVGNDNQILAPFLTCEKYMVGVRRNPNLYHEAEEYTKTADFLNIKERIARKLGLNFTFSDQEIIAIYDLCRYSWDEIFNKPCPLCAVFSVEDLKVLEYIEDLRQYHRTGYGVSQYTQRLGQMPMADVLRKFEQAKNGTGKKVVSYFTHGSLLDMILVALNMYKDTNPPMGAYRDINRKWRTAFLTTFASNMIAVLNRCSKHGEDEFYNVAFYWNEKPLLDMCDRGVCSWQEFEDIFKPFLNVTKDFC